MRILTVTITAGGERLARRLPWETAHGSLGTVVRDRWASVDGIVLFAATGIAVRVIAPLLAGKTTDPAVVCVDEAGRWAVALCGGHQGGANDLARSVAALLGATPVVTTATDAAGLAALDLGLPATGDLAGVTRLLLDGARLGLDNPIAWPLPTSLANLPPPVAAGPRVTVSDFSGPSDTPDTPDTPGEVRLHPPSLIVGVGASSGAPAADLFALAGGALAGAGLSRLSVGAIATLDRKATEPAIVALAAAWGVPIRAYPAPALAAHDVPNPSAIVDAAVGTPSVSEAAALLAAGPGASLVVEKQRSATATVAVARRTRPAGHLWIVGLGPGAALHRTPAATAAVRHAEVVVGYGPYIDLAEDAIAPGATVLRSPIGDETKRAETALAEAADGRRVALLCSGDAGVYALATLVFELATAFPSLDPVTDIEVVPGVTAALAASALLGAPLGHDHAAISLSDLLTPWEVIETRLRAAAASDLVVTLYNPRSAGRDWQLGAARDVFAAHRPPTTPVGLVTDAGRPHQRVMLTTLAEVPIDDVGMTTCVVIGSTTTRVIGGRMVTPRGYGAR